MKKIIEFIKKYYKDFFTIFIGNFFVAFASSVCFMNYRNESFEGILSGGLSGLSLIMNSLFSFNNPELIATIITWILFIIGWIFLGKKFALQTLLGSFLYPGFLFIFKIPAFEFLNTNFNTLEPILVSMIGGILVGTGCGIIYRIGGSTGGLDIPPLVINKFFKRIKLSKLFFIQDGILVILALIANYNLNQVVIGLISVFMCSLFVEITQVSGYKSYIAEIISDKYMEINQEIFNKLDRGTTVFDCEGGFTGTSRKMIKVMIAKKQYHELLEIVKKHDPNAFMSIQSTSDVFGNGFRDYGGE